MPRRSRLKLITSSSDVTGLCPMRANSLAASIARYHFTGFYPELFSIDLETKYWTSGRYSGNLDFELFFNRPSVRRFDRSPMFSREEAVGIAENAVDKLGDSVSYLWSLRKDRFRSYRSDGRQRGNVIITRTRDDRYRYVKALTIVLRCSINTTFNKCISYRKRTPIKISTRYVE